MFGLEIIKEAERQVQVIKENLKVAQSRQKSYADTRFRDLIFEEGEFVYLKVSPIRGCAGSRSKESCHLVTLVRSRFWHGKVRWHMS